MVVVELALRPSREQPIVDVDGHGVIAVPARRGEPDIELTGGRVVLDTAHGVGADIRHAK